jgi:hypothetical protein
MGLDEFRRARHRIVDWIADYRADSEYYPFLSRSRLLTKFELPSPERPALSDQVRHFDLGRHRSQLALPSESA